MTREIKFRAWDKEYDDNDDKKGRILHFNNQYGLYGQKRVIDDSWTRFWESLARLKDNSNIILIE